MFHFESFWKLNHASQEKLFSLSSCCSHVLCPYFLLWVGLSISLHFPRHEMAFCLTVVDVYEFFLFSENCIFYRSRNSWPCLLVIPSSTFGAFTMSLFLALLSYCLLVLYTVLSSKEALPSWAPTVLYLLSWGTKSHLIVAVVIECCSIMECFLYSVFHCHF